MKRRFGSSGLRERELSLELLDTANEADTRANLLDLARIHRWTLAARETKRILRREFERGEKFRILDVGGASSTLMEEVGRVFPASVRVACDVREMNLREAPAPKVVGDGFRLPFRDGSVEVAHCSLLLHHFDEAGAVQIVKELDRVARRLVLIQDLHRHWVPYWFLPVTKWVLGWHALTVSDGMASVAAGWKKRELEGVLQQAGVAEKTQISWHGPSFRYFIAKYKQS